MIIIKVFLFALMTSGQWTAVTCMWARSSIADYVDFVKQCQEGSISVGWHSTWTRVSWVPSAS